MLLARDALKIKLKNGIWLRLTPEDSNRRLSGVSKKGLFRSSEGRLYFAKEPKPRSVTKRFQHDVFFNELLFERWTLLGGEFNVSIDLPNDIATMRRILQLSSSQYQALLRIQCHLKRYVQHVQEVTLSNAIIEIIASRLSAAILGDLLITPRHILAVQGSRPLIISPSVGRLEEFLSEHPDIRPAVTSFHWNSQAAPNFTTLVPSTEHARILGQAYCVALLFGHYDLVNNINLSNFGVIKNEHGEIKLCIVDWGNALGVGFEGLTAAESAFYNPQFNEAGVKEIPQKNTSFHHIMPFDEVVYPLLPRQIVPNLFDLTAKDNLPLRKAQRAGFYEACDRIQGSLCHIQDLVPRVVDDTLHNAVLMDDLSLIRRLLPTFYTKRPDKHGRSYCLTNVLIKRIWALQRMKEDLLAGKTIHTLAETKLSYIKRSQEKRQRFGSFFRGGPASSAESPAPCTTTALP